MSNRSREYVSYERLQEVQADLEQLQAIVNDLNDGCVELEKERDGLAARVRTLHRHRAGLLAILRSIHQAGRATEKHLADIARMFRTEPDRRSRPTRAGRL